LSSVIRADEPLSVRIAIGKKLPVADVAAKHIEIAV
jgi:hypothetical protein